MSDKHRGPCATDHVKRELIPQIMDTAVCVLRCDKHARTRYKLWCHGNWYCVCRLRTKAQKPTTNLHVIGMDAADCERSRFACRGTTNTSEPTANMLVTRTNTADCTVDVIPVKYRVIVIRRESRGRWCFGIFYVMAVQPKIWDRQSLRGGQSFGDGHSYGILRWAVFAAVEPKSESTGITMCFGWTWIKIMQDWIVS